MKNCIKSLALFVLLISSLNTALYAGPGPGDIVPKAVDATIKSIDSIKINLAAQGFVLVKEAVLSMESEYEMPIIVPLNQGSWYHIVFVGDETSKLYELRMFDNNEKQVVYEKHYGNGMESNIIRYSYVPKFSEYHMIKPLQVNKKKKNMNGYILLFKKIKQ